MSFGDWTRDLAAAAASLTRGGGRRRELHWLTPDLAIGAAPSASTWRDLARQGIIAVAEVRGEASDDGELLAELGLDFVRVSVPDHAAPSAAELQMLVGWLLSRIDRGQKVLVHCERGLGRSATVGCAVLIALGFPLPVAYRLLKQAQSAAVLSRAQVQALEEFAGIRDAKAA